MKAMFEPCFEAGSLLVTTFPYVGTDCCVPKEPSFWVCIVNSEGVAVGSVKFERTIAVNREVVFAATELRTAALECPSAPSVPLGSSEPAPGAMELTWPDRIRELEAAGWSLKGLSDAIKLSPQAISDIKQGRTKAPTGMAAVLLFQLPQRACAGSDAAAATPDAGIEAAA